MRRPSTVYPNLKGEPVRLLGATVAGAEAVAQANAWSGRSDGAMPEQEATAVSRRARLRRSDRVVPCPRFRYVLPERPMPAPGVIRKAGGFRASLVA